MDKNFSPYVQVVNGQVCDDCGQPIYILASDNILVCENCRTTVQPTGRIVGPSPDEIGAGEVCTGLGDCSGTCAWDGMDFVRDVTVQGVDGEAPCWCEHHEAFRLALAGDWKTAEAVDNARLALAFQPVRGTNLQPWLVAL